MKTSHTRKHNLCVIILSILFISIFIFFILAVSTENINIAKIYGITGCVLTILTIVLKTIFTNKGYIDDEI